MSLCCMQLQAAKYPSLACFTGELQVVAFLEMLMACMAGPGADAMLS